jgi:hypothetical protein
MCHLASMYLNQMNCNIVISYCVKAKIIISAYYSSADRNL